MKKTLLWLVAVAAVCASARADRSLAGVWHVEGDGFAGEA